MIWLDYLFRIFGKKRSRKPLKRDRRVCPACGKTLTVRVTGVIYKHRCVDVVVDKPLAIST